MKAGVVVGGRYRLVEPLASGGMGTVWRARHVELDVDVAVKVMSEELLLAPSALARFQREAKAAAQLRSAHVVQVFDYGVQDGQPYLAMELLHGEDLRSYLERKGALPLGRAAQIVEALAKALRLAHAAGIVHRDLKPANVFLHQTGEDEVVKVLDFGIAKDLAPQPDALRTSSSTVVGSPLYMSPEQVRGGDLDHRTDLWSLAVVLFEMVTGRQPFEGTSLGDVFARIVADDIPTASSLLPGLPASIDAFFERALARPVAKRFQSAIELAAEFRKLTGDDRDATTRVAPDIVPRVARDAPTLVAVHPSSVAARTASPDEEGSSTIELARTVATPSPITHTVSGASPVVSGRGVRVAGLAAVILGGVGLAIVLSRGADDRGVDTPPVPASAAVAPVESSAPSASSVETMVAPDPARSATPSAAPSAPIITPSGPARTSVRLAPPPPPRTAAAPPPPATGGTAIDPIFGVPVKRSP
jgi:serine/threonine protein kinase